MIPKNTFSEEYYKENYILQYYNEIENGNENVSKKVKKQIKKCVNDLLNQDKYKFDLEKANKPIHFIEKFCKHSKGKLLGKPVILELWQKAIIQIIFGFVDFNGFRRYREVVIIMGRKNGKSLLLSAIALYMFIADGEGGAQVCCVANKKDQARIVFNETKNMISQSPLLKKHIKKRKSDLYFENNFSTFEPLSSDSNSLDGLNVHCGILDEFAAFKDRNLYDVIKQSMTARSQPLLFLISTAGFVRENFYDQHYEYVSKVIDGVIEDERLLALIYELDSKNEWTDPKCYKKANPGLGKIKDLQSLLENVEKAKNDPHFLPTLLTKDFNIRSTSDVSWLTFDTIDNQETFDIDDLRNSYAVGGCDLSAVGDLTCATVIVRKNKKYYVLQMYFIPEDTAEQHIREDRVPYDIWEQKGLIRFCKGSKVSYSDVTKWFLDLRLLHNIIVLWTGYDAWSAAYWIDDMINNAFQVEKVIQGAQTFSTPMKLLEADLKEKKLNYNNNNLLKWCLTNTSIECDKNENIRPIKKNSKQRIDGTVSLIDAYVVLQRHYQDFINMTGGD